MLPYALLQASLALITIVYTLVYLLPQNVKCWALWIPFTLLCGVLILSPWVISSTFVLDSNYWRGVARPSRLRGFGVFIRMFATNTIQRGEFINLEGAEDVDLWADLLTDSLVSEPLQVPASDRQNHFF